MKNKKIEIMRGAVLVVLLPCVALTLLGKLLITEILNVSALSSLKFQFSEYD